MKEQILIGYLGCGWVEAQHPWSKNDETYTLSYLFRFFKETVIPLEEEKGGIPEEPPLEIPSPPAMGKLGTTTGLALKFKELNEGKYEEFKNEARSERDKREAKGKGDRWSEMQRSVMPKMDELDGFKIEMLFEGIDADGESCLEWYHGEVKEVLNRKSRKVRIVWDDKWIHPDDLNSMKETKDVLLLRKWNQSVAVKRA